MGALADLSVDGTFRFFDRSTYPVRPTTLADRVRIVPGGSTIRDGCYVAPGVDPPGTMRTRSASVVGRTGEVALSKKRDVPSTDRFARAPILQPRRRPCFA